MSLRLSVRPFPLRVTYVLTTDFGPSQTAHLRPQREQGRGGTHQVLAEASTPLCAALPHAMREAWPSSCSQGLE